MVHFVPIKSPRICFGAIVIHFILHPSGRSDQISWPWLNVVCWWLTALYDHNEASPETLRAIVNLEQCISDIQTFLLVNKFSRNPKKTEVIRFHSWYPNIVPENDITIGDYSILEQTTWLFLRETQTLNSFKNGLKTFLFREAFFMINIVLSYIFYKVTYWILFRLISYSTSWLVTVAKKSCEICARS